MFDAYVYSGLNLKGVPDAKAVHKEPYRSVAAKCGGIGWHLPKQAFQFDLAGMRRYLSTAKKTLIIGPDPWLLAWELQKLGVTSDLFAVGNLTPEALNTPSHAVQTRQTNPAGLGGPRIITDYEISLRYGERGNPLVACVQALSPHVRASAVLDLIAIVKEPRWFATFRDVYGLNALAAYLGIDTYKAYPDEEQTLESRRFAGLDVRELLSAPIPAARRQVVLNCVNFDAIVADVLTPTVDPERDRCLLTNVAYRAIQQHGEEVAELAVAKVVVSTLVHGWHVVSALPQRAMQYNEFVDYTCFADIVSKPLYEAYFDKVRAIGT